MIGGESSLPEDTSGDPACAPSVFYDLRYKYLNNINLYNMYDRCYELTPNPSFYEDVFIGLATVNGTTRAYKRIMTMQDMTPWLSDIFIP